MNYTSIIADKELKSYFNSPAAYIVLVIFLLLSGWFFASPLFLNNTADLRSLFGIIPIVYLFFIPAVTMNLISREKSSGTIELLSTLPLKESDIVMGKFWASLGLTGIGLLFTLIHLITIIALGTNIDYGAIFCGYLGLILMGGLYSAIGIFTSSITNNQIIAFIISFFIAFFLFIIQYSLFFIPPFMAGFFQYLSVGYHFDNISRGVIDTRNLIYFISGIVLFLKLSVTILEIRKWK
ncbi:MAG: ABC transporter [Candidatus Cloacimonadota bacterium]|nr:MAG: ABC transporter [Candidatus Cloacimonadota bacterium]RLC53415.1 MAG: ABC transporter [Candidatus Cloacimonadota bacterium]